ncbi:MarR family transcriptional regulator [Defluviimonas sp. WL0002]|uniref:MarR family transcriptional regulator n=1 Tax=Albidovulum marisflavi TaxID=2984159 RepID=A0ABT2ZBL3_9RHOB|nr:MarR family transcriptional regulator [Defluviimonas sp. WL0002]MCV2868504.1 MarR family transcriptional regulator [Defluviimonas sp. WL0002]
MTNKQTEASTQLQDSIRRLQWHLWRLWRQESQDSGSMDLTSTEYDYLDVVAWHPEGLRLTDLAERMGVSKASASAMASKLEARGYLERSPDPDDKRASLIRPTPKTSALESEESAIHARAAASLSAELSAEELARFEELFEKACRGLPSA